MITMSKKLAMYIRIGRGMNANIDIYVIQLRVHTRVRVQARVRVSVRFCEQVRACVACAAAGTKASRPTRGARMRVRAHVHAHHACVHTSICMCAFARPWHALVMLVEHNTLHNLHIVHSP